MASNLFEAIMSMYDQTTDNLDRIEDFESQLSNFEEELNLVINEVDSLKELETLASVLTKGAYETWDNSDQSNFLDSLIALSDDDVTEFITGLSQTGEIPERFLEINIENYLSSEIVYEEVTGENLSNLNTFVDTFSALEEQNVNDFIDSLSDIDVNTSIDFLSEVSKAGDRPADLISILATDNKGTFNDFASVVVDTGEEAVEFIDLLDSQAFGYLNNFTESLYTNKGIIRKWLSDKSVENIIADWLFTDSIIDSLFEEMEEDVESWLFSNNIISELENELDIWSEAKLEDWLFGDRIISELESKFDFYTSVDDFFSTLTNKLENDWVWGNAGLIYSGVTGSTLIGGAPESYFKDSFGSMTDKGVASLLKGIEEYTDIWEYFTVEELDWESASRLDEWLNEFAEGETFDDVFSEIDSIFGGWDDAMGNLEDQVGESFSDIKESFQFFGDFIDNVLNAIFSFGAMVSKSVADGGGSLETSLMEAVYSLFDLNDGRFWKGGDLEIAGGKIDFNDLYSDYGAFASIVDRSATVQLEHEWGESWGWVPGVPEGDVTVILPMLYGDNKVKTLLDNGMVQELENTYDTLEQLQQVSSVVGL